MEILFVTSVGIIASDPPQSRKLFMDALGLPLERHQGDDYFFSEQIGGTRHFGVWPLSQAAQACFGTADWPVDRPVPQVAVEFEVADVDSVHEAAAELQAKGYALLHDVRKEPWGQTIARMQTSDGAIVGISFAPWMHEPASSG
jgi:catechol 2,3-dioxygenase-like lactoylglutathione lyase family enzyme